MDKGLKLRTGWNGVFQLPRVWKSRTVDVAELFKRCYSDMRHAHPPGINRAGEEDIGIGGNLPSLFILIKSPSFPFFYCVVCGGEFI